MGFRKQDVYIVVVLQCLLLVLFGVFARYGEGFSATTYSMFQDVHAMILVGFGFLMTFLKRYGYSAVGFNFLLSALIIQWALLCNGFYQLDVDSKIRIDLLSLVKADIAAATVLISMGALLGRTSYIQLLLLGVVEIAVFSANSYLGTTVLKVTDAGGSIFVHTFGAYFGLAASYVLNRKNMASEIENPLEGSSYTSDLFAMIGTLFLWIFWPSFNGVELVGEEQEWAVINTYLSLTSCCVTAFAISLLLTPNHKFDMVHVQNSTLAGGVAVGTSANLMLQPYGAVIIGMLAGVLSVYGYTKLTPWMSRRLKIRDTCGVHNLHGMPGVLAGIVSAVMFAFASNKDRVPFVHDDSPSAVVHEEYHATLRTPGEQIGYQILGLVITLGIAITSGLITGLALGFTDKLGISQEDLYDDATYWEVPEHECSHSQCMKSSVVVHTNPAIPHSEQSEHTNPCFQYTEHSVASKQA